MPDEHRRGAGRDLVLQRERLLRRRIGPGQLHKAAPVGVLPGRDDRVTQDHRIRAGRVRQARHRQHGPGKGQMPARRKAARRNFVRLHMPCGGVLPHKADGRRQLPQGQAVRCIVPHGVAQHCGVVARRRKLQGHGVALAGAHMAVAAARHHQHQRPFHGLRHRLHAVPQIDRQKPAAGQVQLFQLHHTSSLYTPQRPSGWAAMNSAHRSAHIRHSSGQGRLR